MTFFTLMLGFMDLTAIPYLQPVQRRTLTNQEQYYKTILTEGMFPGRRTPSSACRSAFLRSTSGPKPSMSSYPGFL